MECLMFCHGSAAPPGVPPQLVPRGHHAGRGREPAAAVPGGGIPGAHQRDRQRQVLHRAQVSVGVATERGEATERGAPPWGYGANPHPGVMGRIPTLGRWGESPPWGDAAQLALAVHVTAPMGTKRPDPTGRHPLIHGGGDPGILVWSWGGAGGTACPPPRHIVGSASGVSFLRKCSPWSRNNQSGTGTNRGGYGRGAGGRRGGWRQH